MSTDTEFCWKLEPNGRWHSACDTRQGAYDEALRSARQRGGVESFKVGKCDYVDNGDLAGLIDARTILEMVVEGVYEEYGDHAYEWFVKRYNDCPPGEIDVLNLSLRRTFEVWLRRDFHDLEAPPSYSAVEVVEHPVTKLLISEGGGQ